MFPRPSVISKCMTLQLLMFCDRCNALVVLRNGKSFQKHSSSLDQGSNIAALKVITILIVLCEHLSFFTSAFFLFPSFLIGNLAPSGPNGVGAAGVQQMEATMGGRDTRGGGDTIARQGHHRYYPPTPFYGWDITDSMIKQGHSLKSR